MTGDAPRFRWSDHAAKIAFTSPLLPAAVSTALVVLDFWHVLDPIVAGIPVTEYAIVINGALAATGSTVGGSLIAGATSTRIGVAVAGFMLGLTIYVLCFRVFTGLVGLVLRTM